MKAQKQFIHCHCIVIIFFLVNTLFLGLNSAKAQTSSPYSRYGLGDVNNKVFAPGFSLGGTSIAMQNDSVPMFFINTTNPASYSSNRLTTIELGLNYNRINLESSNTKKTLNNAGFGYVSLAIPLKRWWGASFGLIPFSSVGYKVSDEQEIQNVGKVDFLYQGSGGISQAYFGTALKPLYGLPRMFLQSRKYAMLSSKKHSDNTLKTRKEIYDDYMKARRILNVKKFMRSVSLGANASYLFGNIDNSRSSIFNTSNTFNTSTGTTTRVGDIYLDYGLQFAFTIDSVRYRNPQYNRDSARLDPSYDSVIKHKFRDLKDNVQLLFGINFAAQSNISAKIDSLSYNYYTTGVGFDVIKDTVQFVQDHRGTITLPLSFGAGIGFKKGDRWMVLADFAMQNWSSFQQFNQSPGLKNSMRVSLGAQYVPNAKANGLNNYMKRVHYRIGTRYAQTSLELKNSQLTEYAVSFGMGFPVGRNYLLQNFSMVNMGVEIGQRGTTSNGLIQERFFKATLGFTINDRWFVKPKVD
jgi:hypothetical protein